MKLKLIGLGGEAKKRKIVVKDLPVTLGRSEDADIQVSDRWTSRRHCQIDQLDGTLLIRDLGSTHGTYVNGLRVTEAHLMPGDKLTVGMSSFQALYKRNEKRLAVSFA